MFLLLAKLEKTSLTLTDACDLNKIIKETKAIPEVFTPKYPLEDREKLYGSSKVESVECPYCHSKDTKKISNLSKVSRVALFGIFAWGKQASSGIVTGVIRIFESPHKP